VKALLLYIFINFLFAIGLILPTKLYAQQLSFKLYNVNDGLPSASTYGVFQDKNGYLWICSPTGVSRFDGRQFVNYSLADGLPSLHTNIVFQDSRKRFWVGTAAGMAQFKNNKFITYPTNDNLNNIYVFNFIETKDKRLWALTVKGVYEFADSIWKKLTLYPGYENSMCRSIVEFDGELFVNYPNDIVYRGKVGKWLHIASSQDYGSMFNVMSVQNNEIWVSTINNIYIIRNHQLVPLYKKNLTTTSYFSYFIDSKKRLWLESESFLQISKPGDWQHFSFSKKSQYGYPSSINEDSSHNVWIGTIAGLLKIKDISFTIIDKNNTALLNEIYNLIALPDNRLLLSCGQRTGLLIYGNNKCTKVKPPHSPGYENYYKDPVDIFTLDEKNSLWMLTRFRKFLHFDGNKLEDFSSALNLKTTEHVYDMKYVKSRNEFFICADSTLLYGSSAKFSTFIPHNTGVPLIKPTRVYEMKNGLLLLYIDEVGVFCIDKSNNLISLVKETGIDGSKKGIELPVSFYEDADNNFWLSFPGLGLYEYGLIKNKMPFLKNHVTLKDGLQSNNVVAIINDRQKRLWVATPTGLDILQENKADKWEVFNYAKAEELALSRSDYERLITDSAGNVYLSTPDKILKFHTADINLFKEPPHVIIEKVTLAFKETEWGKLTDSLYGYFQLPFNPVLDYDQNSLGIFFNAIDLSTSNSNPEYSYKLLPFHASWSIPAKTKSVSFAQLPPGKYQFIVRAKDKASGWSKPDVFRFTITSPFWNKWWFRLIVIAIASSVIVSIFRARVQKIRQDIFIKNQIKELEMKALKAQMNPHFIYNALNSIQALVANDKKTEGIYYIGSFSRLLRQVLDNSENNVISLDKELETVGLYIQLEALRLDMQLQYKKNIAEDIVTEFEKIPPLILQPFVENALWHGLSRKEGEKEIIINVKIKDNWLVCGITDNGIGRKKEQEWKASSVLSHQSKGIDITRKRLIDFNEDNSVLPIEFSDLYDLENNSCGTSVTLHIKRKTSQALPLH
jgi:ligand-binding sensor domain-containing protein